MSEQNGMDVLRSILYTLQASQYETGGLFTIGGVAGTYFIKSPFNTESEYCVLAITSSNATAGSFALSSSNPNLIVPVATSASFSPTTQGSDEANAYDGMLGWVTATSPATYSDVWLPLGRGAYLYFKVAPGANNSIFAQIAFRRSYAQVIPELPRQQSRTHNIVGSRRALRIEAAQNAQGAGYQAQYPDLQYHQQSYKHEEIPQSQDPQNLNPLTPDAFRLYRARRR